MIKFTYFVTLFCAKLLFLSAEKVKKEKGKKVR